MTNTVPHSVWIYVLDSSRPERFQVLNNPGSFVPWMGAPKPSDINSLCQKKVIYVHRADWVAILS